MFRDVDAHWHDGFVCLFGWKRAPVGAVDDKFWSTALQMSFLHLNLTCPVRSDPGLHRAVTEVFSSDPWWRNLSLIIVVHLNNLGGWGCPGLRYIEDILLPNPPWSGKFQPRCPCQLSGPATKLWCLDMLLGWTWRRNPMKGSIVRKPVPLRLTSTSSPVDNSLLATCTQRMEYQEWSD